MNGLLYASFACDRCYPYECSPMCIGKFPGGVRCEHPDAGAACGRPLIIDTVSTTDSYNTVHARSCVCEKHGGTAEAEEMVRAKTPPGFLDEYDAMTKRRRDRSAYVSGCCASACAKLTDDELHALLGGQ